MARGTGTKELSKIADRRLQALEMRKGGGSYRAIARQLGISEAQAYRDVARGLKDIAELQAAVSEDVRTLEIERLDALLLPMYQQARQGNQGAVDRVLRIMERRARLLGLDAPTKIAPTNLDGTAGATLTIEVIYRDDGTPDPA